MKTFFLWFRIIRPQTLFASVCPVLVALIITGVRDSVVALLTALCSLSLQVLSNLINDYYDFKRGADKKSRAGFRRALAEGEVSQQAMLRACYLTLAIALGIGIYLIYIGGLPILAIGLSAILFAWLYTATSHSLSYLGIADIFVFLYYGVLASMGTAILQDHAANIQVFSAGAVCGLISMCVLMINNLRDYDDDKLVGKKTLPVRFGKQTGNVLLVIYTILMPMFSYLTFGASLPLLIVLPALFLSYRVYKAEGKQYNVCLLCTGLLNLLYTILAFFG